MKVAFGHLNSCGWTRSKRRDKTGKAKLEIQAAERSGALVAKVEDISFAYGERTIVSEFSTTIMRGDKIGVIGPNGAARQHCCDYCLGNCRRNRAAFAWERILRSRTLISFASSSTKRPPCKTTSEPAAK